MTSPKSSPKSSQGNPAHARSRARRAAVQALYQWQISGTDLNEIDKQFKQEQDMSRVDMAYFVELLHKIPAQLDELDQQLTPFIDRPMDQIDPVERAILRIGVYELSNRLEIPYRVILNEAVQLTKTFGASGSYKYVNGVLDKAAAKLRKIEKST